MAEVHFRSEAVIGDKDIKVTEVHFMSEVVRVDKDFNGGNRGSLQV